jgi:hypothetical protein
VCEDEENEVNPREADSCEECGHLMCEDCEMSPSECDVCLAKIDEDEEPDGPCFMCKDCMESCEKCEVSFHPSCKAKHMKSCGREGRAMRAVASAKKAVDEKEQKIQRTKRKLRLLEQELEDTKKVKVDAKKKLKKIVSSRMLPEPTYK